MKDTQISAVISQATKDLLDQHVRATGVKKGHLLETALLHHLQALQELPSDILVHPRIVVSLRSAKEIQRRMEAAGPTRALRNLMSGDDDGD
ncbi:MAG: hypothetical protein ACYTG3_15725 [Planctomycetota bacterium]|jgi:hypothetical protein